MLRYAVPWLKDEGFSAEFSVEVYVPNAFATQESAIEAAIQAERQKVDVGFERGSVVVNG